ncbi:hypothetical protein JZ751_029709, partial [Albula glossodonta]
MQLALASSQDSISWQRPQLAHRTGANGSPTVAGPEEQTTSAFPERATTLHETKRRPTKLPILPGAVLTFSRSKLGERLYKSTTDFITDSSLKIMRPDYNSLHDPHLRNYYHRRDLNDKLKKGNFITADNESGKRRKFIELQDKGIIPGNLSLAEMENLLDEDRQRQRRAKAKEDISKSDGFCYRAMDIHNINEDERAQAMAYERQYRHEYRREKYLKEVKEEKDRKKQLIVKQKCDRQQKKIMVESEMAKEPRSDDTKPKEHQRLLPSRPRMQEHSVPCPDKALLYANKACGTDQKQGMMERESAIQQKRSEGKIMLPDESEVIQEYADNTEQPCNKMVQELAQEEPLCQMPARSRSDLPALRSDLAKITGVGEQKWI